MTVPSNVKDMPIPLLSTGAFMGTISHLWVTELYRSNRKNPKQFAVLSDRIEEQVLLLPTTATKHKKVLLSFVKPVVQYLNRWLVTWMCSMCAKHELIHTWLGKLNLIHNLRVTLAGTVHGRATARNILESRTFGSEDAFRLACTNCMVDEVMVLWPKVKTYFVHKVYEEHKSKECSEVVVFSRFANETNLRRDVSAYTFQWDECSEAWYEFGVRSALNVGNDVAMGYFLDKIKIEERKKLVKRLADSVLGGLGSTNAAIISLIIRHLGPEQLHEFIKAHANNVLYTLTQWPLWMFFGHLVFECMEHLSAAELLRVLERLATLVQPSERGPIGDHLLEEVEDLFSDLWKDTSPNRKTGVIWLMLEVDLSRKDPYMPDFLEEMKEHRRLIERVFVCPPALYHFLRFGSEQSTTCLRDTLYRYFPPCKEWKDVGLMLDKYEELRFPSC